MADRQHAIEWATNVFCRDHGVAADNVTVTDVRQEQIKNPPLDPGQMSTNPVRYRFFVTLRSADATGRYRVEGKNVYRD